MLLLVARSKGVLASLAHRVRASLHVPPSLRTSFVARLSLAFTTAFTNALYVSSTVAVRALVTAMLGTFRRLHLSGNAVVDVWRSQTLQLLRNKLFYEFAIFILGGGNAVILLLFWPGWLLVGGALWTAWNFLT